jgi:apolipoprotein N-acyltransferase
VDLVLAYLVPKQQAPLLFLNRYAWITQDGELLEVYDKHHPVPGEPVVQGTTPLQVHHRPYGEVAGAICYDFDFPSHARTLARDGAGLLVVPSSDWAGIDPMHTQMARVRAIESGVSVLRPVRWATSAGFDAQGRVRGWMPVSEDNDRVLVVDLPTTQVSTAYASLGDAPMSLAGLYLLGLLALVLRRRRATATREP